MSDQMETFSLFDDQEEIQNSGGKLDVVQMEYKQAQSMTWKELFSGYSKLKAITFSSGINFVYQLLDQFDEAEVIFGCEGVLAFSLQEIFAFQGKLIERIRNSSEKKEQLLARMQEGSVHFYVAHDRLSHEKIYLLEAEDGRKRVITGSANMSFNAFGGVQRENICYLYGDKGYDW